MEALMLLLHAADQGRYTPLHAADGGPYAAVYLYVPSYYHRPQHRMPYALYRMPYALYLPSYYHRPQYTPHTTPYSAVLTTPHTVCLMPYALLTKPYASCLAY